MGELNKNLGEVDHAKIIIESIYRYLINLENDHVKDRHFDVLVRFSENINDGFVRNLVISRLQRYYEAITLKEENLNLEFSMSLLETLSFLKYQLESPEHFNNDSINSENYYNKKIQELQQREFELNEILRSNNNQTEEQKRITEETAEKLKTIELELNKKKKELEIKQKQEDVKSDWEQKINNTFIQLKDYLEPIKKEHDRLNILYYVFAVLSIVTIIIISIIEINAICKLSSNDKFPNFEEYLMLFLPLPIAGALMWGFVFQMNRAQRQLLVIAKNIHNINYIQGLLISINNLSPNINDGILRINKALDNVIFNHLEKSTVVTESDLLKEEEKDNNKNNIDLDKLVKLIKTLKETGG
ncbi:hypothetical protein [Algibacter lectus]|uniref:Uncharacterized protein n=1 Tax=Algibacter lectus TaxID=221126 RepID=A0A090VLJ0_9FLAO|nr:hypothetical protein [Algibacter lectus]GAL64194.1 hypothetical protein JCM19300_2347 [Algibacter lectus]